MPTEFVVIVGVDRAVLVGDSGLLLVEQEVRQEPNLLRLPAEQIVKLYEYCWQVGLFFRFLKQCSATNSC